MIVRQKTLPWIPGQRSGGAQWTPRKRGMGDAVTLDFPWLSPANGASAVPLPCIPAGNYGPPQEGQTFCSGPAMTTADNWDSKTSVSSAKVCFQPLFPFVGQASADGSCVPVVNIPSPWPVIITAGLGAFLGYKLLGGRR